MKLSVLLPKVEEFLNNRKNSNNIVQIWNLMQEDTKNIVSCILALEKLFTTILERNDFYVDENWKITKNEAWKVEVEYVQWLKTTYDKTLQKLYQLMEHEDKAIQEQALVSVMKLMKAEVRHQGELKQPLNQLEKITEILTSTTTKQTNLINRYQEFTEFIDVFCNTWKFLKQRIISVQKKSDIFILNILDLINSMRRPKNFLNETSAGKQTEKEKGHQEFCQKQDGSKFHFKPKAVKKSINKVWECLINRQMTSAVHHRMLIVLLESFLTSLENPIFLTDFLMSSLNIEGAISLLALQGMSILIQKHNIEYPNVYGKLYNMFKPEMLQTKFKSRLFYLADVFLSSLYLPEQLVAAFVKRVSRLALSAQVPDILIMAPFIGNLILRHTGLRRMIHSPTYEEVAADPFDNNEKDPLKSRATESSLWELSLLKQHVQPRVSSAVSFIDSNLPSVEWDLSQVLDKTSEQIFQVETKKKVQISLNYVRPLSIAKLKDNCLYKIWSLS